MKHGLIENWLWNFSPKGGSAPGGQLMFAIGTLQFRVVSKKQTEITKTNFKWQMKFQCSKFPIDLRHITRLPSA
jgi:hypothetical protein